MNSNKSEAAGNLPPLMRENLDLRVIAEIVKRRRWIIAGATVISGLLAFIAVIQITPLYTGEAAVAIETRKTQVVDVAEVIADTIPDQAAINTQAEIMQSPALLGRVVTTLRLDRYREFTGVTSKAGAARSAEQAAALKNTAVRKLANRVEVAPMRNSYVLTISARSQDPVLAAKIANSLADGYIADQIESKYEATRRANSWLEKRVDELRETSLAADKAAEVYRISQGLVGGDANGTTVAGQQLTEINSQYVQARAARAEKQAQLAQINRLLANGGSGLESSSATLQSGLIASLRSQETEILRKLSELRTIYGERHPKIVNATAELRDLREKIRLEIQKIATSTANDLAVAQARERELGAGLQSATSQSAGTKLAAVRYRELLTEAQSAKNMYESFLNRYKETTEQLGIQSPDARVIVPASVPTAPSYPNTILVVAIGLAFGLVLGGGVAFLLERFDPYVRSAEDVEALLGQPVLSMIPLISSEADVPELAVLANRTSPTAEALVSLKASITTQFSGRPHQVVLITSAVAGEGKTFLALSFARSLALGEQRVLLIDLDLRRPRVGNAAGLENTRGMADLIEGRATIEEVLMADPATGMDIILTGPHHPNPDQLLLSSEFGTLIKTLRTRYDTIIIDSAPIAPLSDSQVIAKHVDLLLLAVAWSKAPIAVVKHTVNVIRRLKLPLAGAVLTLVDLTRYASYDRLGYSYYYDRYKSYTYGA